MTLSNVKCVCQLSLGQLSQQTELTVSTCQRIVPNDLEDSVTAERYWNNILDVFINQLQSGQGYFQQDGATAREIFDLHLRRLIITCFLI
jgi:hypothetical protein